MLSASNLSFPDRIYLIGFMGSGKSTIGRLLAKKLNYTFVDMDLDIESEQGSTISDLFEIGEKYFRGLEAEKIRTLSLRHRTVISTGGGTPCYYDNMDVINFSGISVYLDCDVDSLYDRLSGSKHRPLLTNLSRAELRSFIASKLAERNEYYQRADVMVDGTKSASEVLDQIINVIS